MNWPLALATLHMVLALLFGYGLYMIVSYPNARDIEYRKTGMQVASWSAFLIFVRLALGELYRARLRQSGDKKQNLAYALAL